MLILVLLQGLLCSLFVRRLSSVMIFLQFYKTDDSSEVRDLACSISSISVKHVLDVGLKISHYLHLVNFLTKKKLHSAPLM